MNQAPDRIEIAQSIHDYLDECRARVPEFCRTHFGWRGAWRLNRHALGADFLRVPLNIMFAPVYLLLRLLGWFCGRLGLNTVALWLRRCPPGIETAVQREAAWLIHTELLQLPYEHGQQRSERNRLFEYLGASTEQLGDDQLQKLLASYGALRTASTEITNNLLIVAGGAVGLNSFTPGAIAAGVILAGIAAREQAISEFWLGETVGSWWYGLFPPEPSGGMIALGVGSVALAVAIIGTFSGFVLDPLLNLFGIHQRRLYRLIDSLEHQLIGEDRQLRGSAPLIARLLDAVDLLRTAAR